MPVKNEEARKKFDELFKISPGFPELKKSIARKIAIDLNVNERTLYKWAKKFKPTMQTSNRMVIKCKGGIDDFRARYDDSVIIPQLIQDGIEKYLTLNGEPAWMIDRDFREACGVAITKWRRYADDFKHLQASKDGQTFWGHPNIIDEMRKALNR